MKDPIGFLASRAGRYSGPGVAHDTRAFTGVLIIDPPLNPANLSYRFTATATDGELLHTEIACLGRNQGDEIEIVHISNNIRASNISSSRNPPITIWSCTTAIWPIRNRSAKSCTWRSRAKPQPG